MRLGQSRMNRFGAGVLGTIAAAAVFACGGQALADRGGHGGHGYHGGGWHGNSGYHGSHYSNCGSGSSWSISIGTGWYGGWGWGGYSSCGPSWSVGYGYGSACWPRSYYAPPVVVAPCPTPVYVAPVYSTYVPPRVVYSQTAVVERPVTVAKVVDSPVYVSQTVQQPAVVAKVATQEPKVTTATGAYRDRELGDAYMRLSDWKNAARVYNRYLRAWDQDGTATRNLGLAQIAAGEVKEGFANVARGYQLEPDLMDRPVKVSNLGGDAALQTMIDEAVRGADIEKTADGWFTVAVLRSITGDSDQAANARQRAKDAGLSADLLDQLTLQVARTKS